MAIEKLSDKLYAVTTYKTLKDENRNDVRVAVSWTHYDLDELKAHRDQLTSLIDECERVQ